MELAAMAKKYEATIRSLDKGSSSSRDTCSFGTPSARIAGEWIQVRLIVSPLLIYV